MRDYLYKKRIIFIGLFMFLVMIGLTWFVLDYYNLISQKTYKSSDFGIETVLSTVDYNKNGVDDYTDILLGARADAIDRPTYKSVYYSNAYPPDDIGVCTDVLWRAFKNAGYSLRDMVDNDIINRPEAYTRIEHRDNNIDFRRVYNLHVFFKEHAISLTTDINDIEQWQPGDIVIFNNDKHIGIVSDKRNRNGRTYIIHNGGQPNREEDYLNRSTVVGHYRFDASLLEDSVLKPWH